MIVRVFRAEVRPEQQATFEHKLQTTSIPLLQAQDGMLGYQVGRPLPETPNEYVIVSTWRDLAALRAFVGQNWSQAFIPPGMEQLMLQTWVHHYELQASSSELRV